MDPTMGEDCKVVDVVPEKSHIAFAVDKSGSMSTDMWDHDKNVQTPTISRWNSTYNVLTTVLVDFEDDEEMALALFPGVTATNEFSAAACVTAKTAEVSMALSNADEIILNLPGPMAVNGGGGAVSKGVENALDEFIGTPEYAPRAVVLITDSPSACNADAITISQLFETYDDTLHTLVTDAYNEGILTYVIGIEIPNTTFPNITDGKPNNINPLDKLNELAVQGGRPLPGSTKFYHLQDELEFKLSLQNILEDAKSCNLVLGNPATLPTATVVEVAGKSYDYEADLDCATDDGWIYLDDTYTAIQLCGASCAELKSAGTASVTIGC